MTYYENQPPVNLDNVTSINKSKITRSRSGDKFKIVFWFIDEEDYLPWVFDTEEHRDKVYNSILEQYGTRLIIH